jgi:hypothetical protein
MRSGSCRFALGFLVAFALASGSRAAAQDAVREAPPRWNVAAELGWIQHDDDHSTLSVGSALLRAHYRLSRTIGLGVDWGLVLVNQAPSFGSSLWLMGSSDPFFKVWYARTNDAGTDRVSLAAGFTAPMAWLSYDIVKRGLMRSAYAHAAATRGLWNAWLWAPEQVALVVAAEWAHVFNQQARVLLEGGAAVTQSISQVTRAPADAILQLAAAIEARPAAIAFGLRFQGVLMTAGDATQFSAVPYLSAPLGSQLTLVASVAVNLDPPLGLFGAGLGMWGALLALRGNL